MSVPVVISAARRGARDDRVAQGVKGVLAGERDGDVGAEVGQRGEAFGVAPAPITWPARMAISTAIRPALPVAPRTSTRCPGAMAIRVRSAIQEDIPLFMVVVLFGLSMDYHVFILTRVRELYDRGMSTEDAVSTAIKSTAGVVTSAAVVMFAGFAVFGTLSWMMFKQMGVGLAFAVLLDATVIRGILLPATIKLLGDWNWWLPGSMSRMPKIELEGEVELVKA